MQYSMIMAEVVNIAVLVLLPIVSVIGIGNILLPQYCYRIGIDTNFH